MVKLYDTTLRDGAQGEGVSFSLEDKLKVTKKLDSLGIHYIEGGWPGSNPKDISFFQKVKSLHLKNSTIVSFGSTRKPHKKAEDDLNLQMLIRSGTDTVTIFGKSWILHVKNVLKTTPEENLKMISDSITFLKTKVTEVFYDAEHFFDGYKNNPDYAIKTLKEAQDAGANLIVLCDTNGGTMPDEVKNIIKEVRRVIKGALGIHTHNDAEMAVANTIVAVKEGATQVQGTINGYGERCGNANLCSIIPNLKFKLGIDCLPDKSLSMLAEVSHYVAEIANLIPQANQPYVGMSAFAHKGGVHIDAIQKHPLSYEHISPEKVGNRRRILVSELSGKSSILYKAEELGLDLKKDEEKIKKVLKTLKNLEHQGYQFEGAEGSFELLVKKIVGRYKKTFNLKGFRIVVEKRDGKMVSEATIRLTVKGKEEHTAALGDGPVNALDNALRKALEEFYPVLKEMHLTDYKVRILNPETGTKAVTRVLIESSDKKNTWGTVGVSENIIEASWKALVDSIEFKLSKEKK
ncbi:citramalate synthase [Candidatus Desantisbacteria bacterium CG1_02_38_46]|uniref:Citramalate synthase n=2 Tax=unclassified Candidatus Desantisiibacteriota TaxID=3106372 RepID=A0A2H9PAU3_9BACT|nr:MAG: citramalate synthase [Candidatus Desantisbacteria bacterium CG1_02_38_46]PIZ15731.1 MAG: citramalate synthase [Candidatus Desantisbacteria bacterium CG_4_10_14_0_8_um_filter_39_17]